MKEMKKVLCYLVVFFGIQLIGGWLIESGWELVVGNGDATTTKLVTMTVFCSVVTIVVFLWARYAEVSASWLRTRPWTVLAWSVVAALGAIVPSTWLQEQLPELPNWVEDEFDAILSSPWGYLSIGLLAPLSEEIVMRGAVLRELLRLPKLTPWAAIAISAVLFAIIHMNPAQMPHAFLVGLLLGWMYWRTGSILPGMAYHWANNSVAYIIYNIYPDPDIQLIDLFKGSQQHVLLAVAFSLLILVPAIYQLHIWMKRV
mgnify:CR=1 FL=1